MNKDIYVTEVEKKLNRKTSELYTLRNRIHRYWKKLIVISIQTAKEKKIEGIILDNYEDQINTVLENPKAIVIYEEKGLVNADELIELSKNVAPSLYRRYKTDSKKYNSEILELEKLVKQTKDILHTN